jgi:hypothetical protein
MSTRRALFLTFAAFILIITTGASLAAHSRLEPSQPAATPAASNLISPVGNTLTISNDDPLVEVSPAIAYNTTRGEYLAVWYNDRPGNDDIRAQRISKDGRLTGHPFYISAAGDGIDRRYPRVAYNSISDQYLVVWEHQEISSGYSIHARRVSGDGQVLDANDLVIRSAGINLYTPAKPAVAYAYSSNKYLVVWHETWHPLPISTSIMGQVVLDTGALDGSAMTISQDPGGYFRTNPDLAYNIGRNEYLVVWEQLDPTTPANLIDLYVRRVTGEGVPLQPESTQIAFYTVSSTAPAVAALPIQPDGQYLVVFEQHYTPDEFDILGVTISPDNIPQSYVEIARTGAHELQPGLAPSPKRGLYLVTWVEKPDPSLLLSHFAARLVNPQGNLEGDPIHLNGIVSSYPRLASGWLGDFMTVYEDTPLATDSGIYAHLIGNRAYLPWTGKNP